MRFAAMTLLAAALGVACAMLVACGADNKALIPGRDASALKSYADRVGQAAAAQDCGAVTRDVAAAITRIGKLPSSVDSDLRQNLEDGFNNLARQAEKKCQTVTTDTTTTDTTPTETTATETTDTGTTDTGTTDTGTTDTGTTDTGTTDTGTTGGDTSGGTGDGGTAAPGGGTG